MNKGNVVISMGGSVMIPEHPSPEFIREFADILKATASKSYVVLGGGRLAREYISIARNLGADEGYLDEIGISATRLNARLLISALGEMAYPHPAVNFDEAINAKRAFPVVVMGGTHPGHTTDGVAAMLAERVRAERLIIATNVKGVYTADPKKDPGARLYHLMPFSKLMEIALSMEGGAGKSGVVDPLAARIVSRSGIPAIVCDGRRLEVLKKAINSPLSELENEFPGTIITRNPETEMEGE